MSCNIKISVAVAVKTDDNHVIIWIMHTNQKMHKINTYLSFIYDLHMTQLYYVPAYMHH